MCFAGQGNIGDIGKPATPRNDKDIVPEAAVRQSQDENYHTGRGGAANVHKAKVSEGTATHNPSLADKLKAKLFSRFSSK
jgi:hypothetical protein